MMPLLADITLSIYFGASQAQPSDLHVVQQARGNDATFHGVRWSGYPMRAPIYYGIRVTYAAPGHPWTRIALDFTHFKVYADPRQALKQDGTWHGARFSEGSSMQRRVQWFEITHGINLLGVAVLQHVAGPSSAGAYLGGGPVIYLPHAETTVDGMPASTGYAYGGGGFEALAGVRGCAGIEPLYAEAKYSRGVPLVAIAQGHAWARVDALHELAGIDFHRCPR